MIAEICRLDTLAIRANAVTRELFEDYDLPFPGNGIEWSLLYGDVAGIILREAARQDREAEGLDVDHPRGGSNRNLGLVDGTPTHTHGIIANTVFAR